MQQVRLQIWMITVFTLPLWLNIRLMPINCPLMFSFV